MPSKTQTAFCPGLCLPMHGELCQCVLHSLTVQVESCIPCSLLQVASCAASLRTRWTNIMWSGPTNNPMYGEDPVQVCFVQLADWAMRADVASLIRGVLNSNCCHCTCRMCIVADLPISYPDQGASQPHHCCC